MSQNDKIFVHRTNLVNDGINEIDRLGYFYQHGFRKMEVDVTVTGADSYSFCHPSMLGYTSAVYTFDSSLFHQLAALYKDTLWLVDIKYLDEHSPPVKLAETIHAALGANVIFSAALPPLLTAAHKTGARTAQFFRCDIQTTLPFVPDYFILKSTETLDRPLDKIILHCPSIHEAEHQLARGVAYVMVDSEVINARY